MTVFLFVAPVIDLDFPVRFWSQGVMDVPGIRVNSLHEVYRGKEFFFGRAACHSILASLSLWDHW